MGVYLSTTAYSPLALTSVIIGFISFVFTLGTFFKVVWINLETMSEAAHDVHAYLTALRTELLEEKASIRTMRKQSKRFYRQVKQEGTTENLLGIELDEVTLKTMNDGIKALMRKFRDLERPFLMPGTEGIDGWKDLRRRRRGAKRRDTEESVSPYYEHSAYASPPEKEKEKEKEREKGRRARSRSQPRGRDLGLEGDEDDVFWAQRTQYRPFDLKRRLIWLGKKSEAQSLFETLSRVQIRRIARQVGGMSMLMHEYGQKTCRVEHLMERVDERMNRIVGVRRVE
ncbi:hypothetical protein DOTSEDRAFT_70555 [Lecanosticta acicola]|uniref:Uncharacterized protein n=1 Tax=Lecanosticta acicola TaxID=111012 RepID=A0AAI8W1W5_9PEZI|nr:hypothetical protein DOTSEDRAFT_70555 [Lecanosticta acicola]